MNEKLVALFFKYLRGSCSPMEIDRVSELIALGGYDKEWETAVDRLAQMLADADGQDHTYLESKDSEQIRQRILQRIKKQSPVRRLDVRMQRLLPYAAVIFFAFFVGAWIFRELEHRQLAVKVSAIDAQPASDRATLRFADGRTIDLSAAKGGIVVDDNQITYKDGTEKIVYLDSFPEENLVLTTPKGGVYTVVLPDGSQVWLNAASRLSYPARFSEQQRLVEIEGEAYFAVFQDAKRPFKVRSRGQEVVVLGTAFNISAYADDDETKTTLVSGAVQVVPTETRNSRDGIRREKTDSHQLLPGEQSRLQSGNLLIRRVEVATEVGWKNGDFIFDGIELREAMKQLSRWYDVEVVYEDTIPPTPFHGSFSRTFTLAKTLEILREGDVNFSLQKQGEITKLIVRP